MERTAHPPLDLVVFDLMGTVVKDSGAMDSALRQVLTHYSIPFGEQDVAGMRGAGKRAAFGAILERTGKGPGGMEDLDRFVEEIYATFKGMLSEGYRTLGTAEIPGAGDTMRWLRSRGIKVAGTSAVDADLTEPMLQQLGWAEGVFDAKVSTQEVPAGRPAPYMIFTAMLRTGVADVRRVAVVGDTPLDLQAGNNAGCGWVIGVLSGAHGLETLGTTRHTHLLKSVADLPSILSL